ncbi:3-hydroxyacyl-CoA dehydrogenase NAD-binding domain-containing protein [Arthrobacter castelli]|uniref:3-hydroxyacyl-CoA dehydrogenase NAD-binding domain-containing protein n=1 Tax=Arthrobacter castelli TaxID=271431 RepID=UPI000423D45F|nr:3-hydroxyacyl-CoA dehydrogenase NAD-binding domain-containing protein [Arthrobacter castelli]
MKAQDFQTLAEAFDDEIVTYSHVKDVQLPGGAGTMALITLDNDLDAKRPTTLGPTTLMELGTVLEQLHQRAAAGELAGVAITGKPDFFVAGADLSAVKSITQQEHGVAMAQLGHYVFELLGTIPVPSFAFINGVALGGGLEVALHAHYRTVSTTAGALALPETFLGLVPGWGGIHLLPRLVGPDNAITVLIENALNQNRTLSGPAAFEMGIADLLLEPNQFLDQSLAWAASIISGDPAATADVEQRRGRYAGIDEESWNKAAARGRAIVESKTSNSAPAPARALDLFEAGLHWDQAESARHEDLALADLIATDEFRATVYGFLDLLQKRAKRPAGAPDKALARDVTKVGVVGAGLMASQLALLFARQLKVPVVLTDIDQGRVEQGVAYVHGAIDKMLAKGRLSGESAEHLKTLVTGSVDKSVFHDADFVIEAVFEELSVKKQVFAEVEAVVSQQCVLATNTSSLSVTAMAAELRHPERLVGFHFFNPVAAMPLLEIVRTPDTGDAVLATAFALAKGLKKNAVLVKDAAAFVVNRVLGRMFGEITQVFDEGTDAETADNALRPMGLPMSPFKLLALVGLPVGQHVQESLHEAFGDRFHVSANQQRMIDAGIKGLWQESDDGTLAVPSATLALMDRGSNPSTSAEVLQRTQDALADEIGRMLDESVVAAADDIDLCMIMGAGWPLHMGGITPYLDRTGAAERVNGKRFHRPGIASRPEAEAG